MEVLKKIIKKWKFFVSNKEKKIPFLQNSWKHYEAVPKFLLSKIYACERIQSKDKTHLKRNSISKG